ncbi:MAG: ABC transporter ATP-binding protein [Rickettsiales bacterium]|nr:ABC transporter ATP-binding protein [Rickettsiales bacterium]MCA0254217.1 ABC transporter ATP-binding protein/permease [Pseudomonadota bacterium]
MAIEVNYSSREIITRLLRDHVSPYKGKIFVAIVHMIIVAICAAAIVRLVQPAIDRVFLTHDRQMLVTIPLLMLVIYSIKGVAEYYQGYIIKYVGQKILTNLQMLMYEHLLYSDYLYIKSQSSGRLISRFTNDIMLMRGAISNLLVGCAKYLLSVLFLIGIMFSLDPILAGFIFLAFPIAIYPVQKLGRRMRKMTSSSQEELGNFTAKLDETFTSIKVIKSFCTEDLETERAKRITSNILVFFRKAAKFDSLTSPIMEILSGFAIACVLWYGGYAVIQGKMTTGSLFAFITAFVSAYRPYKSLVSLNVNLQEGIAAANRVFNVLDSKPTICDVSNAITPYFTTPKIEFKNLNMRFSNGKTVLKSIDLSIEPGNTYAFVGSSGSGKTTIANLLIRMFDPTEGEIYIDNYSIKQISLNSLRGQIAVVSQETVLFDTTVYENIAYGLGNASEEEIIHAATAADAHEFIMSLPNGYQTIIGTNGSTLSGGQRQRISIARAFLKNAPILLLDEATSALDPNSERSILDSLSRLRKGRTTIVITHRLNSIKDANMIVVMKHGRIIEQGTHQQLIKIKKEYFKLFNKQLKELNNNV